MAFLHRSRPGQTNGPIPRHRDYSSDSEDELFAPSTPTTAHIFASNTTRRNTFVGTSRRRSGFTDTRKVRRGKKRPDHFDTSCGTGGRYASSDGELENSAFLDTTGRRGGRLAASGGSGSGGIIRRSSSEAVLRRSRKPITNTDGVDNTVDNNNGGSGSGNGGNDDDEPPEEEVPPFWTRVWNALFPEENDRTTSTFVISILKGLVLIGLYLFLTCYAFPRLLYYILYMIGLED